MGGGRETNEMKNSPSEFPIMNKTPRVAKNLLKISKVF